MCLGGDKETGPVESNVKMLMLTIFIRNREKHPSASQD